MGEGRCPSGHQQRTILGDFLEEGVWLVSPSPEVTMADSLLSWGCKGQCWDASVICFHL